MLFLAALGTALALLAVRPLAAFQFSASVYDAVKPSVLLVSCGSDKAASGFLWSNPDTAVTALHVVTGCQNITVYYEALRVSRPAILLKVLRRADLALLKISNAPNSPALQAETNLPPLDEQLSTLGFPLQIRSMSSTSLRLRYGGKTLRDIVPESVARSLSGGSPSLDLEIANIDGHLLPGHSGAPLFNQQRKVVAVADGGLENGAVAVSWAIPAKFLNDLAASSEDTRTTQTGVRNAALFSAETDAINRGETTCSGQVLVKLRSVSFSRVSASTDDPAGLMQLAQYFAVDPSGFSFDVYQHMASGATLVIPVGAALKTGADGDCTATLSSGAVSMHVQLAVLASPLEAQARSQAFEFGMAGGQMQGWMMDPQWTYPVPYSRFDGLVFRRRAYFHVQMPAMFQDRYLFEALAVRNNVFLGSAATYSMTPALAQRMAMCRSSPNMGNCGDVVGLLVDWVRAALAIQLTTFPVG